MADEAEHEGNQDANRNGLAGLAKEEIEETGEPDDGVGQDVIQEDDAQGHDKTGGIADVVQTQQELDQAGHKGSEYAPAPTPTMADEDQRQHADDGHAATEGQIKLEKTENGGHGDEKRAFRQFASQVLFHRWYHPFCFFRRKKKSPHARTHVEAVWARKMCRFPSVGLPTQVPRVKSFPIFSADVCGSPSVFLLPAEQHVL